MLEYFVGGSKRTVLFRRILRDPELRAAQFDTGFLELLLARPDEGAGPKTQGHIAALAAAIPSAATYNSECVAA